jgi:hypothetical protein
MQEALRAARFTEETITTKIVSGLSATRPIVVDKEIIDVEDADTRSIV